MLYYRGMKSIILILSCCYAVEKSSATANQTITVNRQYKFGQTIVVKFNNPEPALTSNWVGIFSKADDKSEVRLFTCGNFYSCTEEPRQDGQVTFSARDPRVSYKQWIPLKPGNYEACLLNDNGFTGYKDNLIGQCESFKIKSLKKKKLRKSRVWPTKKIFSYEESITVRFKGTFAVPNQWIAIYADDPDNKYPFDEYAPWIYSGCGTDYGNQPQSQQCSIRRKKGEVEFNNTLHECWPIAVGKYRVYLVFSNNQPYTRFKRGGRFEIVA